MSKKKKTKVAIQGIATSFHEVAAMTYFQEPIETVECLSFHALCESLKTGESDFAVMAIENSIAGSILPFVKSVVKHLSAVTAVSSAATSYVGNYVSTQDMHIVPNGVDLIKYHLPAKVALRKNILYVGRLEKRKGNFIIFRFRLKCIMYSNYGVSL